MMMKAIEIVGFGSAAMQISWIANDWPNINEEVFGNSSRIDFGGKAAGQITAASKIGAKVALIANLGDDRFGKKYLDYMRNNEVHTDFVTICAETLTGINQMTTTEDGVRQGLVFEGATNLLDQTDIEKAKSLLCEAKAFICQQDVAIEATQFALRRFRGVTILNVAPNVFEKYLDMLRVANIVCCDAIEAGELLNKERVVTPKQCIEALGYIIEKGARLAIITLGSIGTVYADNTLPLRCIYVPVQNITDVDLTLFTNSFIGAYAHLTINYPEHDVHQKVGAANELAARLIDSDTMEKIDTKTEPSFNRKMNLQINLNQKCYAWEYMRCD
ncbi:ribokinase-like [Teleopsis dalmanni]|uniref:ribokinase-like n=1 Tax=Teleopsis dalmanni TaxID=139649 RepID=UPI0018CD9CF1|nr:ribokinase-like [Teleopsis dalmanni]